MKCSPNRAALRKEPHSCSKSLVWVKQVDNELELIHIYNYVFIFLCGICRWLVSSIGATSSASTGSTSKSEFATVNMHNANWTSIIWGQWQWETDDMTIKSKVALWAKANQPPVPVNERFLGTHIVGHGYCLTLNDFHSLEIEKKQTIFHV